MTSPRSLDPIFSPRSVAVVGASRDRGSIGYSLIHNLLKAQFEGAVFPVNPKAGAIHSLKAYGSVGEIPEAVDLAVIAVPREHVPEVVDDCIEHGVKGLVVVTAGFAETGEEGARMERELCAKVRAAGMRMVGPNCMGVINTDPAFSLNATFAPTPAVAGSIGFVSQSGALGVAILNVAQELGIGLTQFASMGNKADVSGNDLLEYWEHDDGTKVIAMYLESFGNPRHFTQIAKRVSREKPILVVKSGRTSEGARAASSHTGAIAGADVTVSAFLEQCGVLRADTIEELFHIARALDRCPLPAGSRVGIVTNAGGPAIMATDACVNLGLSMAELSAATEATLASFLPAEASVHNPVDMIASASQEQYARTLQAVLDDDSVDLAMVINVTPLLTNPMDVLESISEVCQGAEKPVLVVMMATEEFYETIKHQPHHPPVYRFPESAARAMKTLARYAEWRRRPVVEAPKFEVDDAAVSEILRRAGEGYLPSDDAFAVLDLYGVPRAGSSFIRTTSDASEDEGTEAVVAAARGLGFPVVIKADAEGLVHKSDLGGVVVGLEDEAAVRRAVVEMRRSLTEAGYPPTGYLVQEMVRGGHEVIFGISTDPRFGPLVMFGLGGKYVEVFKDVRFGVTPLDRHEAEEMVRGIRGFALLEGVRGEAGADLDRLVDTLLRLAQLAERHPVIRELDINPFLAGPDADTAKAVDVRIRVDTAGSEGPSSP
ncbi:MAG: acetate--CoA ligase family protein [Acidobacteriota bacterium]